MNRTNGLLGAFFTNRHEFPMHLSWGSPLLDALYLSAQKRIPMDEIQRDCDKVVFSSPARRAIRSSLTLLIAIGLVVSAGTAVSAQTTASPRDVVANGGIQVSPRHLRPGQTVYVTLNLSNQGPLLARSQGPSPRTAYTQGETYTGKGLAVMQPDRYSVVMTLSGPRGREWPYRWGLGGDLKLSQRRRVTFPLRLTEPGLYTLFIGIALGEQVRELSLGQIGLEVAARGKAFQTRDGSPIGTPPPTQITINGKAVAIDQWPIFYRASLGDITANPEIMVPIRFVTEEMGAEVDWDSATRTAHIRRGDNHLALHANSRTHQVNGKDVPSHTPLRIVGGRTMVPINFLIEQLGGTAHWDLRTRTLTLALPDLAAARQTP